MDPVALAAITAITLGAISIGGLVVKCLWGLARLLDDLRGAPGHPGMIERLNHLEQRWDRIERALGIEEED